MPQSSTWHGAAEQCSHCLQVYAYELEVRCTRCDGAACPFCLTRIDAEWVCVVCTEETDADEGDVES
jgi:hypothetical protein